MTRVDNVIFVKNLGCKAGLSPVMPKTKKA